MKNNITISGASIKYGLSIENILSFFRKIGDNLTSSSILSEEQLAIFEKNVSLIKNMTNIADLDPDIAADRNTNTKVLGIIQLPVDNYTRPQRKRIPMEAWEIDRVDLPRSSSFPRLLAAAKEFNIGQDTLLDFLIKKGFNRNELKPTSRLSEEMYMALHQEFKHFKYAKSKYDQIASPIDDFNTFETSIEAPEIDGPRVLNKIDLSSIESSIRPKKRIYAISLVERCIREENTYLDLGYCGLTDEDFSSNNDVHKLLIQCVHLKTLVLSNEWWDDSEEDRSRQEFKTSANNGDENKLSKIPESILSMINLTKLIIAGDGQENGIKINQIENLNTLIKLEYLDVSNNQIEEIRGLNDLTRLRNLDLAKNIINEMANLDIFTELRVLDLSNNKIEVVKGISGLRQLEVLSLFNNEIDDIKEVEGLVNLGILSLSENRIKDLSGLENLHSLKSLYLSNNQIEDIKGLEFVLDYESEIYIEISGNPFLQQYQLKLEKNENHFPFIKELLMRQMDSSEKNLFTYPIKILMLGNHASGKSSIVDYLTNQKTDGSTHILRIENYFFQKQSGKNVLPDCIFYDFGGQDFYHGLYQAFISKDALQLIIFNSKTDKNELSTDNNKIPIINFNQRFWLGQKNYQENSTQEHDPYIIVQTHADVDADEFAAFDYGSYYGYKKNFFLSFKKSPKENLDFEEIFYEKGKEYFKAYLNGLINKLHRTSEEPKWYIQFLKFIINKTNKDYAATKLSDVLSNYKVKDLSEYQKLESLKTNLITLHRHGLVMYYPHIKKLQNIVWLNPQKLVEYIQENILNKALADSKKHKSPGIIAKIEFEKIVKDEKILLLLQEQKVIFLHNPSNVADEEEYIIPNYLPLIDKNTADSQLFTFGLNKPNFVIKFNDFIPFGFINQMICFFGKQPDVKKFWRNQLLFTLDGKARILIELDFELLKINVHFQILNSSFLNESYLKEYLFFSIMALYWNFKNDQILSYDEFLNYKKKIQNDEEVEQSEKINIWRALQNDQEYIPKDAYITIDEKRYVSCVELFQLTENSYKIQAYNLADSRVDEKNIKDISSGLFESFTHKKLPRMKKVFVSYSKYDEEYLQEFEDHLITLKQEGIATFNCKKIEFGKEWDEEIKKQIEECDIMVCLVSVKFLNTDYINKIEIPMAIDLNKIIVPLIIKACDWENSTLGKYQAAQRGKVVSLDSNMKLLGQIRGNTQEERAAFWTDITKEFRNKLLMP